VGTVAIETMGTAAATGATADPADAAATVGAGESAPGAAVAGAGIADTVWNAWGLTPRSPYARINGVVIDAFCGGC